MSANICNICGANLIYKDGKWVCPACGAYRTEEISNEEVTLLYNAAQKLRLASFDDAEEAYRDIIAKYPENSEAHWGLVLSKYGIKYEDDYDGKKLPTCYATSIESVLTDKDYLDAVRLCKDKYQKENYIEQGKILEKIRIEWLEKASKEPKYDIFLCFKDSDKLNNMVRTDDSIEVANLYTHLSSLGYKVFYSSESLRDKVAEKYEPYIYNALNTATTMIVYGSKIEYFSSVWMKNEWTRYVRRLREGLKIEGSLIIACEGVNPSDLPRPLNQMQVLDARKKTFYGDLEAHIAKIISIARRPKATVERVEISSAIGKKKVSIDNQIKTIKVGGGVGKKTPVVIDNAVSVREIGRYEVPALTPDEDTKLKSVNLFLQKELFDNAQKVVDEILGKNKYNGQALLADLLIRYRVKNIDELSDKVGEIEDFTQFNTVIEYNDKEVGEKLIAIIGQKIRLEVANSRYNVAIDCLKKIVIYNSDEVFGIRTELRKTSAKLLTVAPKISAEIFDILLNSYQDSETYIDYIQSFVDDCIKNKQFSIAQKYNERIIELDDGNLKATFAQAYIYVQATSFDNFVSLADKFVDFKLFDNALKHFDENSTTECFNSFRKIVARLILRQKSGNAIVDWFDFIVKYEFVGRDEFIEETMNSLPNLKDLADRAKVFDHVIKCIDGNDIERHIASRLSFAAKLLAAENYTLANKYYKEALDIEEGNLAALWGVILCNIGAARKPDIANKIENFSYFTELETLLRYCPNVGIRTEYLDKLVNAVLFKSATICDEVSINKLSKVFDGIIKYYPEECNEILIKHLQKFADNCKNSSAFSLAEKYYAMVLAIDNMKHEAYWGLLQAKLNCRNNDDLIKQKKTISEFSEFSSAIAAASNDERSADKYASIAKNQIDYWENQHKKEVAKKRKNKKIAIFSSITAAVLVIVIALVGVFKYINIEKNFKFVENESGYTINVGKYYKESNVEIPATYNGKPVTKISDGMFENDTNITTITLPSNITHIGNNAFKNCTKLKRIIFKSARTYGSVAVDTQGDNYEINAGALASGNNDPNNNVTFIGEGAFYNCLALESIDVSSATSIGKEAFYGCSKLESASLNDNLAKLADGAFNGCLKLNNMQLPSALTEIGANCFVNCKTLENIVIPATTNKVGANILNGCTGLKKIVLEDRDKDLSGFDKDWKSGIPETVELKIGFRISLDYNGATSGNKTKTSIVCVGERYMLPVPERVGYKFIGWYDGIKDANKITDENGNSVGVYEKYESVSAHAIWEANLNEIVFNSNGGEGEMDNQKIATDATVALNECLYTKKGYTFAGWGTTANGDVNHSDKADYMMGTNAQYILYAIWMPNDNTLHFESNGGSGKMSDITIATDAKETLPANAFTKIGYDFVGWAKSENGGKVYSDGDLYTMGTENATLYALWTPKTYEITYNLEGGQLAVQNKINYNIETATFNLNNPIKRGYEFKGWSGSTLAGNANQNVSVKTGTYGELTFTANWKVIEYPIVYHLNGGTNSIANPETYTIEQEVHLQAPERKGYDFTGWSDNGVISKGNVGEKTFTANWKVIEYPIVYHLNGETNSNPNPKTYTIEQEVNLQAPERKGYDFTGWSDNGLISKGSVGEKTFTANWKVIEYPIVYHLNGGTNSIANPETYTIEQEVRLQDPERKGYKFSGWTDNGLISKGSVGEKTFTASWEIINYDIIYNLDGGINNSLNPNDYNINTPDIVLNDPTKLGYKFIGWSDNGTIVSGSIGKKTFTANWEIENYTISYNLDGGINNNNNPSTYNVNDSITLAEPTKTGYRFIGWSDNGVISKGSVGEKTFTASWESIKYAISYDMAGGENNPSNPTEYTIEDDQIALAQPSRKGYSFKNWSNDGLIPAHSTGNKSFTAYWEANVNTITFDANGGLGIMDSQQGSTDSSIILSANTFTRKGYVFSGWSISKNGDVTYADRSKYVVSADADQTLYAVWIPSLNTLIFNGNGNTSGTMDDMHIHTNETMSLTKNLYEKTGYSFVGWSTSSTGKADYLDCSDYIMGDEDSYTLYAVWKINQYTITLELNGGTSSISSITKDYNAPVTARVASRQGYTFDDWYADAKFVDVYNFTTMPAENITVYAKWSMNTTGDVQTGIRTISELQSISTHLDGNFYLEKDIDATGFAFKPIGSINAPFAGSFDGRGLYINNLRIENETSFTGVFGYNTGTIANLYVKNADYTGTAYTGGIAGYSETPIKDSGFNGAIRASSTYVGGIVGYGAVERCYALGTIYQSCSVEYCGGISGYGDLKNCYGNNKIEGSYGYNGQAPSCGTLTGNGDVENSYTGEGARFTYQWNTVNYLVSKLTGFGQVVNSYEYWKMKNPNRKNMTEVCKWDENAWCFGYGLPVLYGNEYIRVIYNNVEGLDNDSNPSGYKKGSDGFILAEPKKAGYAFGGWFTDEEYVDAIKKVDKINKTITLYAKWVPLKYTATLNPAGGNVMQTSATIEYDSTYALEVPTRQGYSFAGWYSGTGNSAMRVTNEEGFCLDVWTFLEDISLYARWNGSEGLQYTDSGYYYTITGVADKSVTELYIPEYYNDKIVAAIGENAFEGCNNLKHVYVVGTIDTIGKGAFSGCSALTRLVVPFVGESRTATQEKGLLTYWFGQESADNTEEILQSYLDSGEVYQTYSAYVPLSLNYIKVFDTTRIPYGAFSYMSKLQNVSFDGVSEIEERAFEYATGISTFDLPDTLKSIGTNAFAHTSIKNIVIPSSVQSIDEGVFAGCKALAEIKIPFVGQNAEATEYNAVLGWLFGQNNYDGMAATTQGSWTSYISAVLKTVEITNASTVPEYAFANIKTLKSVTLANTVTTIKDYAFRGCTGLTNIDLHLISTIGGSAFYECSGLTSVNLESATSIGSNAFFKAYSLESVDFSDNLTTIGGSAFYACKIGKIEIPNSIVSIGSSAFEANSVLRTIIIRKESAMLPYSTDMLTGFNNYAKIYVPDGLLASYKSNSSWKALGVDKFYGLSTVKSNGMAISGNTLVQYFGTDESVTIPSSITNILPYAFYRNTFVRRIVIPGTITSISDHAFYGCDNLETVKLMRGTTQISSYAFAENALLQSINLPDTLVNIGAYSFMNAAFTDIVVPNSVTSIGVGAFQGCPLESITLPFVGGSRTISNAVTETTSSSYSGSAYLFGYIFGAETKDTGSSNAPNSTDGLIYQGQSDYHFYASSRYYCYWTRYYIPSALKTVTITDATGISANAFYGCTMIESLTLNEGITTIYDKAFYNCTALKSMSLPSSVTEVGSYAFYGCSNMASITLSNLSKINDYMFYGCSSLDGVVLSETLTEIGNYAFSGCAGITKLTLPNGLQTIGQEAFKNMQLQSIVVPNSVTSIGVGAFQGCPLENITLPFVGGSRTTNSSCPSTNSSSTVSSGITLFGYVFGGEIWGGNAINYVSAPISTETLIYQGQDSYNYYVNNGFGHCYFWSRYYIPSALKTVTITDATGISANAFYGCTMIESLTLNEGITTIYDKAFYNCTALKSMILPSSVTGLGSYAFYECSNMASITLSNLTKINDYTFKDCSSLDGVVLPETLTEIGNYAFSGCVGLTGITIPNTVTNIGRNAFSGCAGITELTLPNGLQTIGQESFKNMQLQSIVVPNSVTSIGASAFQGCSYLKIVHITNGDVTNLTALGKDAFSGAHSSLCIIVPQDALKAYKEATNWSSYANKIFAENNIVDNSYLVVNGVLKQYFGNAETVTLPANITSIGNYAFAYSNVKNVTIGNDVTTIGQYAFAYCASLQTVTIDDSVTSIGDYAINSERDFRKTQQKISNNIENSLQMIA